MPLIPIAMALANFAPMIAGLFGGSKAEDVAKHVVGIAQTVTGQSAPDAAVAAIQSDPNLAFQFQKAVLDQQAQLQQIALEKEQAELKNTEALETLAVQDRASAREMQISTKSFTAPFLALFVTLGFFAVLAVMMFVPLPAPAHDAFMLMLGSLGTAWASVIAYYFGSSASSDRKTEIIAQQGSGQ